MSAPVNRLHVDWTRCAAHGACTELLDGVLTGDDWGYPRALGVRGDAVVPSGREDDARRAVKACPLLALTLTRAPSR